MYLSRVQGRNHIMVAGRHPGLDCQLRPKPGNHTLSSRGDWAGAPHLPPQEKDPANKMAGTFAGVAALTLPALASPHSLPGARLQGCWPPLLWGEEN